MFDLSSLHNDEDSFSTVGDMFTDIAHQRFAPAINTLASLGIVNVTIPKFYPDNYIRHYDFVIFLINSLLTSENKSLPTGVSVSSFSDVDTDASYLPQLSYAADHGLVDRITTSR
ncbi:MAG: S-layer homology domain-containing protein [bacterium]